MLIRIHCLADREGNSWGEGKKGEMVFMFAEAVLNVDDDDLRRISVVSQGILSSIQSANNSFVTELLDCSEKKKKKNAGWEVGTEEAMFIFERNATFKQQKTMKNKSRRTNERTSFIFLPVFY